MKLAIGYSTKDQVELTQQTFPAQLNSSAAYIYWCDGSSTEEGRTFAANKFTKNNRPYERIQVSLGIQGGADAAIAWKLSTMLAAPEQYTHIGLLENDVLLDPDWFEPTMALFEKGEQDGLNVGAVSARSYVDRVLIQRDGYAVMHNIGAGFIIFTREAAEIVLRYFRTAWWQDNVRIFAQLSGIDLRTYACFRGNEHFVTTDWQFEAQLARHGLASLALTPAKCQMIGQNPPLAQQGLELTTQAHAEMRRDDKAFDRYRTALADLRSGRLRADDDIIRREGTGQLFFPHQLGHLRAQWAGILALKWSQGFGPFAYRAGAGGASLSVPISGSCSFLLTGGDIGAKVTATDTRSGFRAQPDLPAGDQLVSINVPGGPVPRMITVDIAEGAIFYGLHTTEPQLLDPTFSFDWTQLPEAV